MTEKEDIMQKLFRVTTMRKKKILSFTVLLIAVLAGILIIQVISLWQTHQNIFNTTKVYLSVTSSSAASTLLDAIKFEDREKAFRAGIELE